jgi:hypothetical protein
MQHLGSDYKNILQRVKAKSKLVKRLSKDYYLNTNHTLKTDEETLARLPKEEFLLNVSNSKNIAEGEFSRIANSIIGIVVLIDYFVIMSCVVFRKQFN